MKSRSSLKINELGFLQRLTKEGSFRDKGGDPCWTCILPNRDDARTSAVAYSQEERNLLGQFKNT